MKKILFVICMLLIYGIANSKHDSISIGFHVTDSIRYINLLNNRANSYLIVDTDSAIDLAETSLLLSKLVSVDTLFAYSSYILGKAYNQKGSYEIALQHLNNAFKIYESKGIVERQIFILSEIGSIKFELFKHNQAIHIYNKILNLSKVLQNKFWKAFAFDAIGTSYYAKSEFETALKYHIKAEKIFDNINIPIRKAYTIYKIGADYTALSQYDKAIEAFILCINISENFDDNQVVAEAKHAMGMIYQELKNYKHALEYNRQSLEIAQLNNQDYLITSIMSNIGTIKMHTSQYDSAIIYFKKGLNFEKKINSKPGIAFYLDNIGNVHYNQNEYKKALQYFVNAWNIIKNLDEKWRKTRIQNHLGLVYLKLGEYNRAKNYLNKSLAIAEEIKAKDLVQDCLNSLSEFYATTGNFKRAYEYLSNFSHLRDSIFTAGSHYIAEMQLRYETGKREKVNELLQNELDIKQLELEKSELKTWLSFLSLLIVSLIGLFSYAGFRVKKKANLLLEQKIKEALKKQEDQQQIIFHQASLSSLGELAAGMAHEINQPLQNIKLCTESIELELMDASINNDSLKDNIAEVYRDIDRIGDLINHVRIFSSQQKNHVIELFEPKSVINDALSLVGKQYIKLGIEIKLDLKNNLDRIRGNPYKLEQVFINLLSNAKDALLHKDTIEKDYKKSISMHTLSEGKNIVLKVIDNGIGIKSNQKENIFQRFYTTKELGKGTGLGLSIVFGIINEMNGSISVESQYLAGTTIKICLPIASNQPE